MQRRAVIIGAGLVGSLLAIYLARQGWTVRVYERRSDPRAKGYIGGRSINLALSARGLWGLAGVGLDAHVLGHDAIAMPGRMIHPVSGPTVFQPYSVNPADAINSVSRGGLNITLLDAAEREKGVEIIFDHRCDDADLESCVAVLTDLRTGTSGNGTGTLVRVEADLLIGADGAYSPVRLAMQKADRFEYSQSYLAHGYKELHIPARDARGGASAQDDRSDSTLPLDRYALDPHALHIWPRPGGGGGAMMIALPNRDGTFTCTLFWPFEGEHSFAALEQGGSDAAGSHGRVLEFFERHYPDAVPLMPMLAPDFVRNPTSSLVTVRCKPWRKMSRDGRRATVLAGDAAHAIVPFYGQGMNCGFEDARVLANCLARHAPSNEGNDGGDLTAALAEYESLRKPNADAIADMAVENFVEMRDKVGSAEFRYRKRIEQVIHEAYPERVTPQYNLVSFSTVPYTEARRRGRELAEIVDRVAAELGIASPNELGEDRWKRRVIELAGPMIPPVAAS